MPAIIGGATAVVSFRALKDSFLRFPTIYFFPVNIETAQGIHSDIVRLVVCPEMLQSVTAAQWRRHESNYRSLH